MNKTATDTERVGVLLFNLGGPETLDDVRPFLFNLFSDPDIIRLPIKAIQRPLAWLIAASRSKKSSGYYAQIGGGSPLRRITDEQARALKGALGRRGMDANVYVGMRYWTPFTEEALAQIERDRITHLAILPLYPQFSISTTGSSLNRLREILSKSGYRPARTSVVCSWEADPGYISALARSVRDELARFPDQDPRKTYILFSAHSVPVSYIKEGDPYLDQIKATVAACMQLLGSERPHGLSFQSKVGPVKWLQPSTDEAVRKLASDEASQVLLVPVSFVSEHIETLYELDILYRDVAREAGIEHYRRAEALNCRPDFIDALAHLVEKAISGASTSAHESCGTCLFGPEMSGPSGLNLCCSCYRMETRAAAR
ncbi:MAG TPA: ferrochelatase [Blastocatellia bacterium]|jgi:ferrochelatase|nr:ferrochelatase [Blastocatellia bacterium]